MKIPTEEQLCIRLNLSRIAVRQALEKLASLKVLRKIQGSGTYINPFEDATVMGMLYYPISRKSIDAALEYRRMFDPYNTQLFIQNGTEEEFRRLEENYAEMHRVGMQGEDDRFHFLDYEFHNIIAIGTHNPIIAQISELITGLLKYYQAEEHRGVSVEHVCKYHRMILDAMHERDEELSFIYCRMHIDHTAKILGQPECFMEETAALES